MMINWLIDNRTSVNNPFYIWFIVEEKLFTNVVLGHDGTLSSLTEKHLNAKLDMLFRKNFYDVAIQ